MLRAARATDAAAIEAFLAQHATTSMFLRGNLAAFGLAGSNDPRATTYWLAGDPITAVFGFSNAGFAMSQAPDAGPELWQGFAQAIAGRWLAGITGEGAQVVAAKRALGVEAGPWALDDPEPMYALDLGELVLPRAHGTIRAPVAADRALLFDWTRAYSAGLHMSAPDRLDDDARGRTERAIASGDARLLEVDGRPVAMTAFNARLPDMVQIGGVYTPPALRGRGYARQAVALHLQEARSEAVQTAILFASGPAACRAYEAIGFQRIGRYTLAILRDPQLISA